VKSATKVTAITLGALMGLGGIEHGIGEILQGNTAPTGILFPSWPDSSFFRIVGGEPAMTVVPDLLVTGILTILISLVFLVWDLFFIERKNSGLVLILLSVAMLVVGGGIFPPVIGVMMGVLATRIKAPLNWWRVHLTAAARHFLGLVWPWSYGICVIAWLSLFPGINILAYFLGVNNPRYTVMLILFAFGSLLVTLFTGFARDSERQALTPASAPEGTGTRRDQRKPGRRFSGNAKI